MSVSAELHREVEAFLFDEAALLDEWRLDDWVRLFADDATYTMPSTDAPDAPVSESLYIVDDDITTIRGRVERLKSRHAHREFPSSRTRHLVTNVRVVDSDAETIEVAANFLVVRARNHATGTFTGRYLYTLVRVDDRLQIRHRRAVLDTEALDANATVSIIV